MTGKSDLSQEFIAAQRGRLDALRAELLAAEKDSLDEATRLQEKRRAEGNEYEDAAQALDRKEVPQAKLDLLQRAVDARDAFEIDIMLGLKNFPKDQAPQ